MALEDRILPSKGHCLCKKTGWEFQGDTDWACYCHCDDCRRNCAAPVVAWIGVPLENFNWVGQPPNTYQSSKGVCRYFCGSCGSPMAFEAVHYADKINLYAASLEDPSQFSPTFHVNYRSKLHWLELEDALTKHDGTLYESSGDLINAP